MELSALFDLLQGVRHEPILVCRLPPDLAELIGAHDTAVWLSRDTVTKQEAKHPSPSLTNYMLASTVIRDGFVRVQPPHHLAFIYHVKDEKTRSWRAYVKATNDGRECYLVSIHRVTRTGVRATYRRTLSVMGWKVRRKVGPPSNPT